MVPSLPAAVPRRGGPISRAAGRAVLRLVGWRVDGEIPDRAKFVVIAAPHRSNWDFVVAIAAKFALGIDVSWLGKHTLFRWPFGALFRAWGGVPIDRRTHHDTVAAVVERFAAHDRLVIGLAPEGTRTPGAEWKSGFWHIANGAGVPILPIAFDWATRTIRLLPIVETQDVDRDMASLKQRYAAFRGRDA